MEIAEPDRENGSLVTVWFPRFTCESVILAGHISVVRQRFSCCIPCKFAAGSLGVIDSASSSERERERELSYYKKKSHQLAE